MSSAFEHESDDLFRAEDLLQRYFDGSLDTDEGLELLGLWDRHPEWENRALKHYEVNHLFRFLGSLTQNEVGFRLERSRENDKFDNLVVLASLSSALAPTETADRPSVSSSDQSNKTLAFDPKSKGSLIPPGILILIVFAWMTFAIYSEFLHVSEHFPKPPVVPFNTVARVLSLIDRDVSDETMTLKEGQELAPGPIRFEKGLMEILLNNGVRLTLEGPVDLQLQSERTVFCGAGRLSASVPKTGKGFTVTTPLASVVDLGTEFFLDVDDDKLQTHMIRGKIEINQLPGENLQLDGGSAAQIDRRGTVKPIDLDPTLFIDAEKIERKKIVRDDAFFESWRSAMRQWNGDPSLLLNLDFEGGVSHFGQKSSSISVGKSHRIRSDAGRWIGKQGVSFRHPADSIELDVPDELNSMTLWISVRIDSLLKFNQALLSSRTVHRGDVSWQVKNDGAIQFLIRENKQTPPLQFTSPPILDRSRWGAWYTISLTVDSNTNTVSHYVDGRCVAKIPMKKTTPILIGPATLGNALPPGKKTTDRSLAGNIDQFMIFKRALTDREIENLHRLMPVNE